MDWLYILCGAASLTVTGIVCWSAGYNKGQDDYESDLDAEDLPVSQVLHIQPNDVVLVSTENFLTAVQREAIKDMFTEALGVTKVATVEGGMKIGVARVAKASDD